MTRMGSASQLGDVRRLSKSIRSSKKSLFHSDYYEDDKKKESSNFSGQRSLSLTALSPPQLEPRMAQLETLEAKMASIEVSLSATPRRKKSGAGTPQPPTPAPRANTPAEPQAHERIHREPDHPHPQERTLSREERSNREDRTNSQRDDRTNSHREERTPSHREERISHREERTPSHREDRIPYREERTPHHDRPHPQERLSHRDHDKSSLRDKENNNILLTLKSQLVGKRVQLAGRPGTALNEAERRTAQDRLNKLRAELDNKRLAIKNIKLALDTIDVTDNIDTRIEQAELEYQLGREELNLLSILEESRNLHASLEESNIHQPTIFSYLSGNPQGLWAVELVYDPKSPQFGASSRDGGLYVDWASEESGLNKGDRLLEVNGKLVLNKTKEEMKRLLSVSPCPAQLVVMRRQPAEQLMSHLRAELSVVREQAGEAERLRDSFRSDNVRLSHRIGYLEEQVAELLERARRPRQPLQLFQKGHQVALVDEHHKPVDRPRRKDLARSTDSLLTRAFLDYEPRPLDYSSETSGRKSRPVPPKKPVRLSLQKASSMQSIDSNGTLEKRALKRTHKGDAPPIPKPNQIMVQATPTDSWC